MNPKPATGVNQGVASAADLYLSNLTRRKPNGWLTPTASTGQYVYCVLQYLRSSPASSALMLLPRRRGITSSTITSSASSCSCNILSQRRGCSSTLLQTASTCYSHSSKLRAHISVASRGISTRVYIPAETAASLRCPYVPLPLLRCPYVQVCLHHLLGYGVVLVTNSRKRVQGKLLARCTRAPQSTVQRPKVLQEGHGTWHAQQHRRYVSHTAVWWCRHVGCTRARHIHGCAAMPSAVAAAEHSNSVVSRAGEPV